MSCDYDLITVGGGLGGSALAIVLAQKGLRVLIVEREHRFADRIRGEWIAPWGGLEAQRLGLYDLLLEWCAHESPFFNFPNLGPIRDLRITTPQRLPALTFTIPPCKSTYLLLRENQVLTCGAEVQFVASN